MLRNITIDARDVQRLSDFWAEALGYRKVVDEEEAAKMRAGGWTDADIRAYHATLVPPGGGPFLYFNHVDEPKTVKDRIHLDLVVRDRPAEIARLVALGATVIDEVEEVVGAYRERWSVLRDPEGNEFCVQDPTVDVD